VRCQSTMLERPCNHIMWHWKCVAIYSQFFLCVWKKYKTPCLEPKSLLKSHCFSAVNEGCELRGEIFYMVLRQKSAYKFCERLYEQLQTWRRWGTWSLYVQNVIVWICYVCVCLCVWFTQKDSGILVCNVVWLLVFPSFRRNYLSSSPRHRSTRTWRNMKGEGDTILRNVGQRFFSDAASLLTVQEFSITPKWKHQNSSYYIKL
jgi:hypothetical protein